MKKSALEIYALVICFFTVICFVVATGIGGYRLLAIVKPDFTLNSYDYAHYQTNDAYWKNIAMPRGYGSQEPKPERPNEATLTQQRQDAYAQALVIEQRSGAQLSVKCLIVILIDTLVFSFHWVVARRARAVAA